MAKESKKELLVKKKTYEPPEMEVVPLTTEGVAMTRDAFIVVDAAEPLFS